MYIHINLHLISYPKEYLNWFLRQLTPLSFPSTNGPYYENEILKKEVTCVLSTLEEIGLIIYKSSSTSGSSGVSCKVVMAQEFLSLFI